MKISTATNQLSALGHPTRLAIFRALVEAGTAGMQPGDLSQILDVPAATLSFHLKELVIAGLIEGTQEGRAITYVADFDAMNRLIGFLTENCCGGSPDACAPDKRKGKRKK